MAAASKKLSDADTQDADVQNPTQIDKQIAKSENMPGLAVPMPSAAQRIEAAPGPSQNKTMTEKTMTQAQRDAMIATQKAAMDAASQKAKDDLEDKLRGQTASQTRLGRL